ncbi:MAG: nitronate monooxygenase [Proteobacteria bacterium]|nr:nitronate monooxygenase [Pseudomonadota bacterium]
MKLKTNICELLGIDYPIVLGGMGGAGTPALAAAVSKAGGLGVLGAADCGAVELRENIAEVRRLTDKPFGVNTLLPASVRRQARQADGERAPTLEERLAAHHKFAREFMEREGLCEPTVEQHEALQGLGRPHRKGHIPFTQEFFEEQMEVIVEERVPVYASGLGSPDRWMDRLHANGTKVMALIGNPTQAKRLVDSGLDVVIAQGSDAGGHNSGIGTLSLVPQVVDAVGGIPVLAAGGIADGRGVAAVLMLGAQGAWIGSAFLASHEANILDFQKQAIIEGTAESSTVSLSWTGKPARVLRSKWTEAWAAAELEPLPMPYQQMISWPVMAAALLAGRRDIVPGTAGQGIGLVREIRPAGEIVASLVTGAETALLVK